MTKRELVDRLAEVPDDMPIVDRRGVPLDVIEEQIEEATVTAIVLAAADDQR